VKAGSSPSPTSQASPADQAPLPYGWVDGEGEDPMGGMVWWERDARQGVVMRARDGRFVDREWIVGNVTDKPRGVRKRF
jgi:hypothetical protein